MGKSLYDSSAEARQVFDKADEILGFRITELCFRGPEETLKQTYITQPAIFVHSLAAASAIGNGRKADAAAGHSLGEYTALVYAGALSFEDGIQLVILRGKLMQRAGEQSKGTMAAVIGLSAESIQEICGDASASGTVQVANYNSPGQIVISGDTAGVKKAMELSKTKGAKLVKELVVHGAFHSPLMESAKEELKAALDAAKFSHVKIPVYMNVNAGAVTADIDVSEIKNLLSLQLTSPVRWEEIVRNMINDGINEFIELGPGKVLQGLIKRIDNNVKISGLDSSEDVNKIL
jgi:[acyl-carrier-protein] S-malonyltransferase